MVTAVTAVFAIVRGRVQGVGFRYSALHEAKDLNVYGWVRNAANGNVEVWAEGPDEIIAQFLRWLHKGPSHSRVESVKIEDKEPKGYRDFTIEY
jgi:acylphosphatase